jgi:AraC-like DNA-binding protein
LSQFANILPYLPSLQTLFFIFLFVIMYREIRSARYILLFMTFSLLSTTGEFLANYLYYPVSVWSYYITIPLQLAVFPALFFYVQSLIIIDFRFKRYQLLHFLPALIVLIINVITFTMIPYEIRVKLVELKLTQAEITESLMVYIKTYNFSQNFIYNLQVIIYSFFLLKAVFSHRRSIENYFSNTEKYRLTWLGFLTILISVFSIYLTDFKIVNPEIYSLVVLVFVSVIGYGAVWQKDIYTKLVPKESPSERPIITTKISDEKEPINLGSETLNELAIQIKHLVESEKLFLDPDLNIETISDMLNVHRNVVSKCINETFRMNFHQYVNEYRIQHSVQLIKDPKYHNITIEGIALNSGFNSKSVFNPAFKDKMKMTPSEYRKNCLKGTSN